MIFYTILYSFPYLCSQRGDTDPRTLLEDPVVGDIAKKHRRTPGQVIPFYDYKYRNPLFSFWVLMLYLIVLQVLLRYQIQQSIVVIPKSLKPHHILENTKVNFWIFIPILQFPPNDVSCNFELSSKQNIKWKRDGLITISCHLTFSSHILIKMRVYFKYCKTINYCNYYPYYVSVCRSSISLWMKRIWML